MNKIRSVPSDYSKQCIHQMKIQLKLTLLITIFLHACESTPEGDRSLLTNFEQLPPGKLTDAQTKRIWPGARLECGKKDYTLYKLGITPHPHAIAREGGNNYLKVLIPGNHYGPITGAQWHIPLEPRNSYYLSYRVKFENEFDFVRGGKLPGLAGGTITSGHIPHGDDGWSARMMFWEEGKISFYLYFPHQSTIWGERLYLKNSDGDTLRVARGAWHRITHFIQLNDPGKSNGTLKAWIDGQEAFYADTILFRKNKNLIIDRVMYSVFMGGGDESWAPANDQHLCFDDFRVSSQMPNP
jgi:hypothetical protein